MAFGAIQAALLPFVRTEPIQFAAIGGRLVAVGVVSLAARVSVTVRDGASKQGDY